MIFRLLRKTYPCDEQHMVEIQVNPPLLPQLSIDPVTLGAGVPALTGVIAEE